MPGEITDIYTIQKHTHYPFADIHFEYSIDFENPEGNPKEGNLEKNLHAKSIDDIGMEIARRLSYGGNKNRRYKIMDGEELITGNKRNALIIENLSPAEKRELVLQVRDHLSILRNSKEED